MTQKYDPQEIETRWQQRWAADHIYRVGQNDSRPKFYALTMFPYTSGDLHIGHWYAMAPSMPMRDSRECRVTTSCIRWDLMLWVACGKCSDQSWIHPYDWTMKNIRNMRRQLRSMGATL